MVSHSVLKDHQTLRRRAAEIMLRAAEIADEDSSGSATTHRSQYLRQLAAKIENNVFVLAVVGEFSRGKSSLINALLDRPEPAADLHQADHGLHHHPELCSRAAHLGQVQGRHPPRRRGAGRPRPATPPAAISTAAGVAVPGPPVDTLYVGVPSSFLRDGIRLVDTPGIGSVNPQHGEATRGFIDKADAVLFLVNTDPVISQSECNFLDVPPRLRQSLSVRRHQDRSLQPARTPAVGGLHRSHHRTVCRPVQTADLSGVGQAGAAGPIRAGRDEVPGQRLSRLSQWTSSFFDRSARAGVPQQTRRFGPGRSATAYQRHAGRAARVAHEPGGIAGQHRRDALGPAPRRTQARRHPQHAGAAPAATRCRDGSVQPIREGAPGIANVAGDRAAGGRLQLGPAPARFRDDPDPHSRHPGQPAGRRVCPCGRADGRHAQRHPRRLPATPRRIQRRSAGAVSKDCGCRSS